MLAVAFAAVPTKGAVYYTGTLQTTDDTGEPKDVFFRHDQIYVNVELFYQGDHAVELIQVDLVDQNGVVRDTLTAVTDDPADGYYNSSDATPADMLTTSGVPVPGEMTIIDLVLYVDDPIYGWDEIDRVQVILREEGLSIDPPPDFYYYPGQTLTITYATSFEESFSVEIINETLDTVGDGIWTYQSTDENGVWVQEWTIPEDAKDGDYLIRVNAEADNSYLDSMAFSVAKFMMMIESDRWIVLPGETVSIEYLVVDMATWSLYSDVDVEWTALWLDEDGDEQRETGELTPSYLGTENYTIPADINTTSDYEIYFWANDSADRSNSEYVSFTIGQLDADVDTNANTYQAGEVVTVTVGAWVEAMLWTDDLPGATVDVSVEKDGDVIDEFGADDLTTGADGEAQHEFQLGTGAEPGTYVVKATVTKVGESVDRMATFEVDLDYSMMVEFDREQYWSGQSGTLTFTVMWGTQQVTGISVFYMVMGDSGIIAADNTTTGTGEFTIPMDYVGDIEGAGATIVNGYFMEADDEATVQKAYIAIAPAVDLYVGGDMVTWNFQVLTAMSTGMISYEITDRSGDRVAGEALAFATAGSFSYTVPMSNPSEWYTATLTVKDGLGNNIAASASAYLRAEYMIDLWLNTDSPYSNGAFAPGAVLEFGYSITTNGVTHLPVYKIRFYSSAEGYADEYVLTSGTSGVFTVQVPENTPDGGYYVDADLYDGVNNDWLSGDWVQFAVAGDQSTWDKEVGGMSMIDFTILMLIIVMIVLLIVVPFLKGRMGGPKPPKHEPVSVPPPEAPAEAPPPE